MITKEWAAIHRKHHAKCETEEDPHSPQHQGHQDRVLARRRAVPRSARRPRVDREVRQGLPGRLDRAPPLHAARRRWARPLLLFVSFALFGFAGRGDVGDPDGCGSRSGPPASSTASATGGATATSRPPTPRPTSPRGACGSAAKSCTTTTTRSRARPSSRCASSSSTSAGRAIKLFEAVGLAKVLRVAPTLDVRPNIAMPDAETIKALLAHPLPGDDRLLAQRAQAGAARRSRSRRRKLRALLPRQLRKGLADDGRWLEAGRARAAAGLGRASARASRTLVEYPRAPGAVLDSARQRRRRPRCRSCRPGAREAEASGIRALQEFSARLKGYALQRLMHAALHCSRNPARSRAGFFFALFAGAWPPAAFAQVTASGDYLARMDSDQRRPRRRSSNTRTG